MAVAVPKGPGATGSISHFATTTGSGLRVVDVWESKEQFETLAQEQIGPLSQKAGLPGLSARNSSAA